MQLQLPSKKPEAMSLDEAKQAYDEAIGNLGFVEVLVLEQYPQEHYYDGAHRKHCKRLYRRILQLED